MEEDFKVLRALEVGHAKREYISMAYLEKTTGIHEERLRLILGKLHGLKLVKRETIIGEKMYRLTYLGYDTLAIRDLARDNVIEAIGDKIGTGKESEIYLGLAQQGLQVAIKFLRIGRTSFRQTKKKRPWVMDPSLSWYDQSKIAAEREIAALSELVKHEGALVPRPLGRNRHVVVTEFIDGIELYRRPPLNNPESVLRLILTTISIGYHEVGIIHGDLSEYNILIERDSETPYIIDWPQYVSRDDPMSMELLRRDIYYIVRFFNRVYRLHVDPSRVLDEVLSGNLLIDKK